MWTCQPLLHLIHRGVLRRPRVPAEGIATKCWTLGRAYVSNSTRAIFLPGQLERVSGWEFNREHPRRYMEGGYKEVHPPNRAYLLSDAVLVDGRIYKNGFSERYLDWTGYHGLSRINAEIAFSAVYSTYWGNRYFGQWLLDDCLTYMLAEEHGPPAATQASSGQHQNDYEELLGMKPQTIVRALLRKVIIFDDWSKNENSRERSRRRRKLLLAGTKIRRHAGVFIIRGTAGSRRHLLNEAEIAERLARTRAFTIIDPMQMNVREVIAACAGARIVAGVEGSQLCHGSALLDAGGGLLTLQPPERFVSYFKKQTDRDGQHFGFVVGKPSGDGFEIDPDEVERTLDLFQIRQEALSDAQEN